MTSICIQVSSKSSFLQTLTKSVSCALSQEFHKLTASYHIPPWPTNTPICLFLLPSEQLSLPRLAPNLHLHADTALTTKQGAGSVTCTGASAITHPALLSWALLFFNISLSSFSTVSSWTSYSWYQLGTRTWPGDSLKMPLPRRISICRLTRLKRKFN